MTNNQSEKMLKEFRAEFNPENGYYAVTTEQFERFLLKAIDSVREEEKEHLLGKIVNRLDGKAPVELMQDGMTLDYSFRKGWNDCLSQVKSLLSPNVIEKGHSVDVNGYCNKGCC